MKWLLMAGLTALTALALGAGTAGTTIIEKQRYSGTDSFSYDDCGFPVEGEVEFSGRLHFRVHKGGQAFLQHDNFQYREVHTNTETGKWFVVRGNGLAKEIKTTLVGGTVYEFVSIEAGQPFVIEDSKGRVVVRDRGVIRFTFLFDTLGDGTPGGAFLDVLDISVRGPHPGFADDFPFCDIAAELTGA